MNIIEEGQGPPSKLAIIQMPVLMIRKEEKEECENKGGWTEEKEILTYPEELATWRERGATNSGSLLGSFSCSY